MPTRWHNLIREALRPTSVTPTQDADGAARAESRAPETLGVKDTFGEHNVPNASVLPPPAADEQTIARATAVVEMVAREHALDTDAFATQLVNALRQSLRSQPKPTDASLRRAAFLAMLASREPADVEAEIAKAPEPAAIQRLAEKLVEDACDRSDARAAQLLLQSLAREDGHPTPQVWENQLSTFPPIELARLPLAEARTAALAALPTDDRLNRARLERLCDEIDRRIDLELKDFRLKPRPYESGASRAEAILSAEGEGTENNRDVRLTVVVQQLWSALTEGTYGGRRDLRARLELVAPKEFAGLTPKEVHKLERNALIAILGTEVMRFAREHSQARLIEPGSAPRIKREFNDYDTVFKTAAEFLWVNEPTEWEPIDRNSSASAIALAATASDLQFGINAVFAPKEHQGLSGPFAKAVELLEDSLLIESLIGFGPPRYGRSGSLGRAQLWMGAFSSLDSLDMLRSAVEFLLPQEPVAEVVSRSATALARTAQHDTFGFRSTLFERAGLGWGVDQIQELFEVHHRNAGPHLGVRESGLKMNIRSGDARTGCPFLVGTGALQSTSSTSKQQAPSGSHTNSIAQLTSIFADRYRQSKKALEASRET